MNLNEPISVCNPPSVEFTKSLIEILQQRLSTETWAALYTSGAKEDQHHVTHHLQLLCLQKTKGAQMNGNKSKLQMFSEDTVN